MARTSLMANFILLLFALFKATFRHVCQLHSHTYFNRFFLCLVSYFKPLTNYMERMEIKRLNKIVL